MRGSRWCPPSMMPKPLGIHLLGSSSKAAMGVGEETGCGEADGGDAGCGGVCRGGGGVGVGL